MADFRPFSPRWGDISFTEAPQTTARCYAGAIFLSYSPSGRHREPAGVEGAARHGAWPRRRWAVAGPGRASRRRAEPHISNQAPLVWRAPEDPEGLAEVPVGGRGAWPRCRWVAAGPGRASRSTTPSAARVWRSRGRAAAHRHTQRPGPQDRKHSGRARRRPEHQRSHKHPGPVTRAGRRPRAHRAARPSRQPATPKGRAPKYPPLVGSLSHYLVEAQAE